MYSRNGHGEDARERPRSLATDAGTRWRVDRLHPGFDHALCMVVAARFRRSSSRGQSPNARSGPRVRA